MIKQFKRSDGTHIKLYFEKFPKCVLHFTNRIISGWASSGIARCIIRVLKIELYTDNKVYSLFNFFRQANKFWWGKKESLLKALGWTWFLSSCKVLASYISISEQQEVTRMLLSLIKFKSFVFGLTAVRSWVIHFIPWGVYLRKAIASSI